MQIESDREGGGVPIESDRECGEAVHIYRQTARQREGWSHPTRYLTVNLESRARERDNVFQVTVWLTLLGIHGTLCLKET